MFNQIRNLSIRVSVALVQTDVQGCGLCACLFVGQGLLKCLALELWDPRLTKN